MPNKLTLVNFGATGTQGGSAIDTVLSRPELSAKYNLRGITRDPASEKARAVSTKGVEIVKAGQDDAESLKAAFSVSRVTKFWSLSSKVREIQQGKNIFPGSQAANVKHLVWSSLPSVTKLSNGRQHLVDQSDGNAEVENFIESNKGSMIASYFMPAMFTENMKQTMNDHGQGTAMPLPFPDPNIPIPYIDAKRDAGRYVLGHFEAGGKADGVKVQNVSFWTTPANLVTAIGNHVGKKVNFVSLPGEVFASLLPQNMRDPVTDMLLWVIKDSYHGRGSELKQSETEAFLVKDAELQSLSGSLEQSGPSGI